jgi:two-component system sensor histidine kinase KdpD
VSKKPEEWLKSLRRQRRHVAFQLFLGYAPGVGKTYGMLSEAFAVRAAAKTW